MTFLMIALVVALTVARAVLLLAHRDLAAAREIPPTPDDVWMRLSLGPPCERCGERVPAASAHAECGVPQLRMGLPCGLCGRDVSRGFSICPGCRQVYHEECRAVEDLSCPMCDGPQR